jgi:hypothetical protein
MESVEYEVRSGTLAMRSVGAGAHVAKQDLILDFCKAKERFKWYVDF